MTLQHILKNSSQSGKEPLASQLANGEIALNYHADGPFLTCKDTAGVVRRLTGVWVGASAPGSPTPGELWLDISITPNQLKIYKDSTDSWVFAGNVANASTSVVGVVELATNAETQAGSDTQRAVTPASLQSKISDSTVTVSATTIASSSAVKTTYDLANAALPKTGGTVTGALEIGTTGRLLVGTSSNRTGAALQVEGTSFGTSLGTITNNSANFAPAYFQLIKSRGTSVGSQALVVNGDGLGNIQFVGTDGTQQLVAAAIEGIVDGTPGANDMPGRLMFSTTAEGASSPTERMRIDSSGRVGIGTASPESKLDVVGSGTQTIRSATTDASGTAIARFRAFYLGGGGGTQTAVDLRAGDNYAYLLAENNVPLLFGTNNTERARIDSSGRLLVGTTASRSIGGAERLVQIEGTSGTNTHLTITRNSNDANAPLIGLLKTRGAVNGALTTVADGDELGSIRFYGTDGSSAITAAQISAFADGGVSTNDLPTRLIFSTTADGASGPTERMRITNQGNVGIGGTPSAAWSLLITKDITGGTSGRAVLANGTIQSGVTSGAAMFAAHPATAAAAFTLPNLYHFYANQGTIGATSAVTNQYGFHAESTLTGATNNYGFFSNIASGANRWNFYANGTADSYFASNNFIFANGGTERARIDSSGRLLVGTSSALGTTGRLLEVANNLAISTYLNNAFGYELTFNKSRGSANGTIVQNGDNIGNITWRADDGTDTDSTAAQISAAVDGTPGTNDMPGRLVFSTTADGASSPTERMRIDSSGRVGIGTTAPQKRLDVYDGASNFWFRDNGVNSEIAVVAETGGLSAIYFGDAADDIRGGVAYNSADDSLQLRGYNNQERARIDSSGRLLVGTSYAAIGFGNLQSHTTGAFAGFYGNFSNDVNPVVLTLGKSRGNNFTTIVESGDAVGSLRFNATDGTGNLIRAAQIDVAVDGTPGANDMPGRLVFSTTADGASSPTERMRIDSAGTTTLTSATSTAPFIAKISTSEVARIDSSGRLLVGTSSARGVGTATNGLTQLETTSYLALSAVNNTNDTGGAAVVLGKSRGTSVNSVNIVQSGDDLGTILFAGADGTDLETQAASIKCAVDGTPGANDMPGRLVFSTTADGASVPTERMRISNAGDIAIGKTNFTTSAAGINLNKEGSGWFSLDGVGVQVNRITTDGDLVYFRQDNTVEGTISVSGTTVSYNGAHLSRWSQLPGGVERTEILRGTVLSNIDEMCEWGEEDNEQLNRMKVSDVEGDKNVSGVFQAWDDDDDTYTNDFYCAMTGDFIIRIAAGVTVERGDLLMSAGDGTAKPQDDDIIRSKTIAKVTSTNVSCTYNDGSYCVPCVLMAC